MVAATISTDPHGRGPLRSQRAPRLSTPIRGPDADEISVYRPRGSVSIRQGPVSRQSGPFQRNVFVKTGVVPWRVTDSLASESQGKNLKGALLWIVRSIGCRDKSPKLRALTLPAPRIANSFESDRRKTATSSGD